MPTLEPGKSFPLGASLVAGGANFSVFSKHASAVQLLLFDGVNDDRPSKVINLDPRAQRTHHYWHTFARHAELHRFVKQLIAFRNARILLLERHEMTLNELIAQHRVEWHGVALGEPDWSDASHSLAATFHFDSDRLSLHLMINAYWEALTFAIPPLDEKYSPWRRCVNTFGPTPEDVRGWPDAETVRGGTFVVQPRSIVVLVAKSNNVGTQS